MKRILSIAACLTIASSSTFAWGEREQGALLGAVIGGIIVNAHKNAQAQPTQQPNIIYAPAPAVIQQAPQIIYRQEPQPQICGYNIHCPNRVIRQAPQTCWIETTINAYGEPISREQVCR